MSKDPASDVPFLLDIEVASKLLEASFNAACELLGPGEVVNNPDKVKEVGFKIADLTMQIRIAGEISAVEDAVECLASMLEEETQESRKKMEEGMRSISQEISVFREMYEEKNTP